MKVLKVIDLIVLLFATAALSFAAYGQYTHAGRKEYRELAGIIPDLSMKLGLILFAVHLIILIITYFLNKNKSKRI